MYARQFDQHIIGVKLSATVILLTSRIKEEFNKNNILMKIGSSPPQKKNIKSHPNLMAAQRTTPT